MPGTADAGTGRGLLVAGVNYRTSPVALRDRFALVETDLPAALDMLKRAGVGEAVLLGSVATGKYVDPLTEALGDRLRFPADFVGRGDMSRGGLLLRCARAGTELTYVGVRDAVRRGPRPPRLPPPVR